MPRRIDVELTSARPDGTWTWRAAGAREPRGELDGGLLPSSAKVGDVLRAEAEFDIDGITVTSVTSPKAAEKPTVERLEIIGPQREFTPVTSTLVGRGDRDRRDRDRGPRRDRGDRPDRPDRDRRDRPRRSDRPDRPDRERPERTPRPAEARGPRDTDRPTRPRRERPAPPPPLPERPKPKRLRPARAHRDELLQSLTPDRRLIAEQLLKGGVPAVRTALDEQNAKARAEGQSEVPTANILQVAEDLMPACRIADWLDRADAALADVEELSLTDLRAVVTSAGDVAREERTRELATQLREALDRRTVVEQEQWVADTRLSLEHGRVVRALRLASRPPESSQTLPEELLTALTTAASAAMTAEIAPDRFATLLDAVAYSPVRRSVEPAGVPAEPGDELLTAVRKHAGRTPVIAKLFGVEPPPPKEKGGRTRPERPKRGPVPKPQPAGPPVDVGGRKIPPPPRPIAKAVDANADETSEETLVSPSGAPSAPGSTIEEPPAPTPAGDVLSASTPDPAPAPPVDVEAEPTDVGEAAADGAAAESAGEVEVVEEIAGTTEHEVAALGDSPIVPPGEGEGGTSVSGTSPVVGGVTDEDDG
ncbi:MAG: hypothetical protein V7636_1190 [Actinomycetota bacterium]